MEKEIMSLLNHAYDDTKEARIKKSKEMANKEEQKRHEMDEFLSRASKNAQLVAMKILEEAIVESQKFSNCCETLCKVYIPTILCCDIDSYYNIEYSKKDLKLMKIAVKNGNDMMFCSVSDNSKNQKVFIPVNKDMIRWGETIGEVPLLSDGSCTVSKLYLKKLMSSYLEGKSGLEGIMDNDLVCKLQNSIEVIENINSEIDNFFKMLKTNAYLIYCQLLKGIIKNCVRHPVASDKLRYSKFIDYIDINNRFVDTSMASQYFSNGMDKEFVGIYNHQQRKLTEKSIMYFRYSAKKLIPAILDDIIDVSKANDGGIIELYYIERDGILKAETDSLDFMKLMNKVKEQLLEEETQTTKNTK